MRLPSATDVLLDLTPAASSLPILFPLPPPSLRYNMMIVDVKAAQSRLERAASAMVDVAMAEVKARFSKDPEAVTELLERAAVEHAEWVLGEWWELAEGLIGKYSSGYITKGEGDRVAVGYPKVRPALFSLAHAVLPPRHSVRVSTPESATCPRLLFSPQWWLCQSEFFSFPKGGPIGVCPEKPTNITAGGGEDVDLRQSLAGDGASASAGQAEQGSQLQRDPAAAAAPAGSAGPGAGGRLSGVGGFVRAVGGAMSAARQWLGASSRRD